MNSQAQVHYIVRFESEARRPNLQTEREQDRWAWWTYAASHSRDAKESRIRQMAVGLGEFVTELRCKLESRFAPEPATTAC